MRDLHDGIVTVHINGKRYRGAYYFRGDRLVVSAYGLRTLTADLTVLGDDRGKAALNLAKLVLIEMVKDTLGDKGDGGLSVQGSTTRIDTDSADN